MRHRKKKTTLGREAAPRRALLRSLATSFVIFEKIKTTRAKAKAIKPIAEKMITLGKKDTLANRRLALKYLFLETAVKKLFEVLGPRYQSRPGGYTRIVKLPARKTDGAEMAVLEMIKEELTDKK